MKVWLPLISTGGGADVLTETLRLALARRGHEGVPYMASHRNQYFPWGQRGVPAPPGTDVVVTHSWFGAGFHRPGIPLVVIEHLFTPDPAARAFRGLRQSAFHEVMVRRYVASSYRRAAATVAVSETTGRQITKHFPWVTPRVIRNGVDLDHFRPPAEPRAAPGNRPLRLLFVGNLIRRKGVDLLPPIMQALGPEFELLYTSGLRTDTLLDRVPNARSLGRLDRDGMRRAYWEADLLLFPSRLEGLPLAVVEAAACGLPAVVSDASSLPESVLDGTTGRICPADDVAAFAAAVRGLAADPPALAAMAGAARAFAERAFDLERMTAEYIDLFEEVRGP